MTLCTVHKTCKITTWASNAKEVTLNTGMAAMIRQHYWPKQQFVDTKYYAWCVF